MAELKQMQFSVKVKNVKDIEKATKAIKELAKACAACNEAVKSAIVAFERLTASFPLLAEFTEAKEDPQPSTVRCGECIHLMFSDCYGECAKGYKGIVRPDDCCGYGERGGQNG